MVCILVAEYFVPLAYFVHLHWIGLVSFHLIVLLQKVVVLVIAGYSVARLIKISNILVSF